ncbi:MAG: Bd3614 family nucleic acid deaminase [Bdellovibrionales bacterium]|nr:Bd3614 family nucleic acid deaminase [Bdellovibrionales bacterium]
MCRSTINVAAKRISHITVAEFNSLIKAEPSTTEIVPANKPDPSVAHPETSEDIAGWMRAYPFRSDRPIIAVLLDQNRKPVLATINSSSKNRLLHAEVNLVRVYVAKHKCKIPRGYQIWVSLKPCCMCGNFLNAWSEDGDAIAVTYLENDPGPKARTSPLSNQKIFEPPVVV